MKISQKKPLGNILIKNDLRINHICLWNPLEVLLLCLKHLNTPIFSDNPFIMKTQTSSMNPKSDSKT